MMLRSTLLMLITIITVLTHAAPTSRDNHPGACAGKYQWTKSSASYRDFDFWLGEWIVVDSKSGALLGYDTISTELDGCQLIQKYIPLNDKFNVPETNWRLNGGSFTGLLLMAMFSS